MFPVKPLQHSHLEFLDLSDLCRKHDLMCHGTQRNHCLLYTSTLSRLHHIIIYILHYTCNRNDHKRKKQIHRTDNNSKICIKTVSYTHLDVYKRQVPEMESFPDGSVY